MSALLGEIGYADALIARESPDGLVLIDGHLRADTTPDDVVPVLVLDVTEAEADKLLLTLDPLAAMAEADRGLLGELLASVDAGDDAVARMLEDLARREHLGLAREGLTDPDAVPALPDEPTSKPGDLWLLGDHRVLCGDAAVGADVERLMGGTAAAMMWSDPPYGVEYVGGTEDKLTIENDGPAGLPALLAAALGHADGVLAAAAPFYLCHPAGALSLVYGDALRNLGWQIRETLVWVKDSMVLGHSDYHYRHEPIFYAAREGEDPPWYGDYMQQVQTYEPVLYGWTRGKKHPWYGRRSETSVFMVDRPKASREHPTMKPTALVERMVSNSATRGDVVLDPFLGSGSTLIACERLGRRCYGIEIAPRYCDVAVRRWQDYTGQKAVLGGGEG